MKKNGSDHFSASTFPMFSTLMQAGRTTLDGGGGGGEEMKEELKKETSQINEEIWLEF